MIQRYLFPVVQEALEQKMVFLAGPRQCGKTTFVKRLLKSKGLSETAHYLNWDIAEHKQQIRQNTLPTLHGILALDELHKYSKWRNFLKGVYDQHKEQLQLLVTGSAKLEVFRRGGDSLQGRYRLFRMHPLSWNEVHTLKGAQLRTLLNRSGFPEPFFAKTEAEARIWSRDYRSRLIREEVRDFTRIRELDLLEELVLRIPQSVGSLFSINSVREDLGISHPTLNAWIKTLESFYHVFWVRPFGAPRVRALKRASKLFLFDWSSVESEGARFENMIAFHLLKWCHWREDTEGFTFELLFFRDEDGKEVDFVVTQNRKPILFVECKLSDTQISAHLLYLKQKFPAVQALQVVLNQNPGKNSIYHTSGISTVAAEDFLKTLV